MVKTTYIIFFVFALQISAQDLHLYQKQIFHSGFNGLPYRILYPENFDSGKKYPLVLVRHGSGERGDDNELQLTHGAALFARDEIRRKYPAIVIFPQCSAKDYWSNVVREKISGDKTN